MNILECEEIAVRRIYEYEKILESIKTNSNLEFRLGANYVYTPLFRVKINLELSTATTFTMTRNPFNPKEFGETILRKYQLDQRKILMYDLIREFVSYMKDCCTNCSIEKVNACITSHWVLLEK